MINDIDLDDLLEAMEEEYCEYDEEKEWDRVVLPILLKSICDKQITFCSLSVR